MKRLFDFVHTVDGGDLGEQDVDVSAEITTWGSGEDFDCEAKILSAKIGTLDVLDGMDKTDLVEAACERFLDVLPMHWKRGRYKWISGPKKGKVVEVIDTAFLPGRADWVLVTLEHDEGRLFDGPNVVLVDPKDLSTGEGGCALVAVEAEPQTPRSAPRFTASIDVPVPAANPAWSALYRARAVSASLRELAKRVDEASCMDEGPTLQQKPIEPHKTLRDPNMLFSMPHSGAFVELREEEWA